MNTDSSCYDFAGQINFLNTVVGWDLYENGIVDGVRFILDWKGYSFGHFTKFNLVLLKHFIVYAQVNIIQLFKIKSKINKRLIVIYYIIDEKNA